MSGRAEYSRACRQRQQQSRHLAGVRSRRESWAESDPDVQRYRAERSRRAGRADPALANAGNVREAAERKPMWLDT